MRYRPPSGEREISTETSGDGSRAGSNAKNLKERMEEYRKAEFPGEEHIPGDLPAAWLSAEAYADVCKEPFSMWVVMKAALRRTKMVNEAGDHVAAAAAFRAV